MSYLVIMLGAFVIVLFLAFYYTKLMRRLLESWTPVVSPMFKKLYGEFVRIDEGIAGTKRNVGTSYNKSDRYVDVENQYKKISARALGLLLAVLTLYINKPLGIFLICYIVISLVIDILLIPFRKKYKESKAIKILNSSIPQMIIALIICAIFYSEIQEILYDLLKSNINSIKK